jgi:hypothetical protein
VPAKSSRLRHGVCLFLSQFSDVSICGMVSNAQLVFEAMWQLKPEVVLLGVSMPGTNGIELIRHMLAEQPWLVMLSWRREQAASRSNQVIIAGLGAANRRLLVFCWCLQNPPACGFYAAHVCEPPYLSRWQDRPGSRGQDLCF